MLGVSGVLLGAVASADAASGVNARAAIVMDAVTGDVLFEKSADEALPPASTTKVLTAIVALESGRLEDALRVSAYAAETSPSKIGLRPGQRMELRHLLYALLLNSANDAATVVAEGLAGSEEVFAARMTARAHQLGASNSRFANAHGLTAPGHVSSARDLAVIFRHGLGIPRFREILSTRSIQVPVEGANIRQVSLRSHNRLLTGHTYPVIGKTGYTRAARRCFVGSASQDNREVIIALLGSSDLWGDAKRLLAIGFGEPDEKPTVVMAGVLPSLEGLQRAATRERLRRQAAARAAVERAAEGDDDEPSEATQYTVQLGPYRSRKTVATTRSRLARRGYSSVPAGRALRVGTFSTKARAEQMAKRLRQSGYKPTVVETTRRATPSRAGG
jgi:D-alanyl-D-alanine carboxypeptidase (penicillin-binding protein 5/6)